MYSLNINKIRRDLISYYFYNLRKNRINTEILLLSFKNKKDSKEFKEDYLIKNCEDLIVTSLNKITKKDLNSKNKKNIILVENEEISFEKLKIFQEENIKILFSGIYDFREVIEHFEYNHTGYKKPEVRQIDCHHFYLRKRSLDNIIDNIEYAKLFISDFLDHESDSELKFSQYSIKVSLLRNSNTITIDTILNDIKYFENTGILTSRLGIFIYKICTFFNDATDKEIGLFYSKKFGKSRPYSNKRFGITNTKGYLINNIRQREEYKIRSEIASYLLNDTNLNKSTISKATGLTINELNRITANNIINELY